MLLGLIFLDFGGACIRAAVRWSFFIMGSHDGCGMPQVSGIGEVY